MKESAADAQRRFAAVSVALVALALSFPASGETGATAEGSWERFQLFASCERMAVDIGHLGPGVREIGLTKESIQAAAESRLRSARLFDSDATTYLRITAIAHSVAFALQVEYLKSLHDPLTGLVAAAPTWSYTFLGTHGRSSNYIMSSLSGLLDQFLVEYLRVNEEAC